MSTAVELSVKHDVQRFLVDHFVEWSINTDGEVDVLVQWQGHELRTWEPLEHLVEDVPVLIEKYVREDGHQQLVAAHRQAVKMAKKKRRRKQL